MKYIKRDPTLENGYNLLITADIIVYLLPWLVLLVAFTSGNYRNIFSILFKQSDPFMILFYAIILVEATAYFIWVCFRGGAAFIAKHPGLTRLVINQTPSSVKSYTIVQFIVVITFVAFHIYLQATLFHSIK